VRDKKFKNVAKRFIYYSTFVPDLRCWKKGTEKARMYV